MHLPTPKLPAKKKAAVPLPTPRLPAASKPLSAQVLPPKAPSATSSLRGSVLSSLMQGPSSVPSPRVGGGSSGQNLVELGGGGGVELGAGEGAFAGPSAVSAAAVSRERATYEVVVRFPGAVDVELASMRQGEKPVLVVSAVRDMAAIGGFGDDGSLCVVGLAVAGISSVPHRVALPPAPATLLEVKEALGPSSEPSEYPKYLLLCEAAADADVAASAAFGAAAAAELPLQALTVGDAPVDVDAAPDAGDGDARQQALRSSRTKLRLRRVVVATNRRPILEHGEARFAPTLDFAAGGEEERELLSTHQLRASCGAGKLDEAEDDGLFWGVATVGYDEALPVRDCAEATDKANWQYVGWWPCGRAAALRVLNEASAHAAAAGLRGDCLVYVHGFNTNLQFAARCGALYAQAMRRPVVAVFAWPSNPPLPRSWAISAVLSVAERNYTAAEQMMQRSVAALAAAAGSLVSALPEEARVQWKAHSMGCYLLLNAINASRDAADARRFHRVVLDAPDVPTWFFADTVRTAIKKDIRFFHCFHPRDEAVEISRQRRGLDWPVPGNGCVLKNEPGFTCLDCANAASSLGNHDYGRVDHTCVSEQANFLDGGRADDRPNCDAGADVGLWVLRRPPKDACA